MNRFINVIIISVTVLLICGCKPDIDKIRTECVTVNIIPPIRPDYSGIKIPTNIAPLNFSVQDSCKSCIVEISSVNGEPIVVRGDRNVVRIDPDKWKKLLQENAGKPLSIKVYTEDKSGHWKKYSDIQNAIASEPVDRYCTYRLLNIQYNFWNDLRECQRNLTSFEEKELVNTQNYHVNSVFETKCINCHMPYKNNPDRFVLQIRSLKSGAETIIADGDSINVLSSKLGYPAWHPGGQFIAFSAYNVQQYFHSVGCQFIDVYDNSSDILIYDDTHRKILSLPLLSQKDMLETWPVWSADGRYLYYCSSAVPWPDPDREPPENFNKTRYNLMRISFDTVSRSFGEIDTVLSSSVTGMSITQPKISPDNRFCIFCMQDYGAYPHANVTSDLYIMDLKKMQYRKMPVNSEYSESWHTWSKNSRWVLFSSKRGGGILTRLYICHIDSLGNASKPFILPQENPDFYSSFVKCYNVPEFADEPVKYSERQMANAIFKTSSVKIEIPEVNAVSGASKKPDANHSACGSSE